MLNGVADSRESSSLSSSPTLTLSATMHSVTDRSVDDSMNVWLPIYTIGYKERFIDVLLLHCFFKLLSLYTVHRVEAACSIKAGPLCLIFISLCSLQIFLTVRLQCFYLLKYIIWDTLQERAYKTKSRTWTSTSYENVIVDEWDISRISSASSTKAVREWRQRLRPCVVAECRRRTVWT